MSLQYKHLLPAHTVTKAASELRLLVKFHKGTINECIMSSFQAMGTASFFIAELINKTGIASPLCLFETR